MAVKRLLSKSLLLLLVIAVIAAIAISFVPLSPLKTPVEQKLSRTLGRNVTVDSVRLILLPRPHLLIKGLTAKEDPAFGEGVFIRAQEVQAGIDFIEYVRGRQLAINSLSLSSPQIGLSRSREGMWSWTSLGKRTAFGSIDQSLSPSAASLASFLPLASVGPIESTIKEIRIQNASVELRDQSESTPERTLYRNISLTATLTPQNGSNGQHGTEAIGNLVVESIADGEADSLKATLPFKISYQTDNQSLVVSGSVGPGPFETQSIGIGEFAIDGEINSAQSAPLTGKGKLSATDLEIHTTNLSEKVAGALKIDQIGDMNPGTSVARLETDFQISQGTVQTTGLRIQQLDGLGDANAPTGSFKIDNSLVLNYTATIVLTPEATSRVKSISPMLGLAVTILETNNRASVPLNVTGDIRNPNIRVDVSRIF